MKLRKYNLLGVLLISAFILSTSIGVSVATDNDDDGVDDQLEESKKRDIQVETDTGQIEIQSKLRTGTTVDKIELSVEYKSDGIKIEVNYESEVTSENDSESEFEIEFSVLIRKLIEFVDQNSNGIYEPFLDTMVQEIDLNSFQPGIYTTSTISNDTTLHYFLINTTDGVFSAHLFLGEEFTIVNETLITPHALKIGIEINNFNYFAMDSQLALYVKLGADSEYENDEKTEDEKYGYASDENGVITGNGTHVGFFTWEENAIIDGISQPVLSTPIQVDDDDESEQKLYLNYPRGNHIYHDPKVGISTLRTSQSQVLPIIIIGSILGVLASTSIVIIIIRKRNRI
ncbi:MAG: hypothetical protein ACFFFT_18085 [Candidatus Thorarchaeota archaeon]